MSEQTEWPQLGMPGGKMEWPECVGMPVQEAQAKILSERPNLHVQIL